MKSATIPPLRVTPEFRHDVETVLRENESLSAFVESSLIRQIELRKMHKQFVARGLAAREESERTGLYVSEEESLTALDAILAKYTE